VRGARSVLDRADADHAGASLAIEARARGLAHEGESFSATVARLIEEGARAVEAPRRPSYVGAGEGPGPTAATGGSSSTSSGIARRRRVTCGSSRAARERVASYRRHAWRRETLERTRKTAVDERFSWLPAEGEGFEPSIRLATDNGFRDASDLALPHRLQPLRASVCASHPYNCTRTASAAASKTERTSLRATSVS
jgi:hypothetical protein